MLAMLFHFGGNAFRHWIERREFDGFPTLLEHVACLGIALQAINGDTVDRVSVAVYPLQAAT
jgi:hypothetical protein